MIGAGLRASIDYYDRDAATFAARYDSIRFEDVHGDILEFLPPAPAAVLDVGAGSGRDARALASRGFAVTAVEPAAGFEKGVGDDIRWVQDCLPELTLLKDERAHYRFILCSAVLMLLPATLLPKSFATLHRLMKPSAHLAISVRDPVEGEPQALFHRHDDAELLAAAGSAGLNMVDRRQRTDALGRTRHRWRSMVFRRDE